MLKDQQTSIPVVEVMAEDHVFSQNELGSFSNLNNNSSLIQLIF